MLERPGELLALGALAGQTEERAERARSHADGAREQARRDAERGDAEAELLHLREAEAHQGAAELIAQTAALYRHRIERVRSVTEDRAEGAET